MATYINRSQFELFRSGRSRQKVDGLLENIMGWVMAALLAGFVGGTCYIFWLLLLKEMNAAG